MHRHVHHKLGRVVALKTEIDAWRQTRARSPDPISRYASTPPTAAARSIAVLPFASTGSDTADDYFADGLTEEVTIALAKVQALRVTSRRSAAAFRNSSAGARKLRRAQGVCEVFVTLDRNLEFQQNIKILSFGIVVVRARSNRIADLAPHIPNILQAANQVGTFRIVTMHVWAKSAKSGRRVNWNDYHKADILRVILMGDIALTIGRSVHLTPAARCLSDMERKLRRRPPRRECAGQYSHRSV